MSYIDPSSLSSGSSVRLPRAWLSVGGSQIPVLSCKVTRKSTRNADTFSADISIDESALYGFALADWCDWDQSQDVGIVIATTADGSDQLTVVTGKIDMPSVKLEDMMVTISGRDKSATLAESKRNQKYANQKSSDIASSIAQDHGLNPNVVDTGSDFAGKTYTDTAALVLNRSDFEVLNQLAEREGYRWYVEGDEFYFEPKEQDSDVYNAYYSPPGTNTPYGVASVTRLTLGKNSTAARPHQVTGKSWHIKDKKLYTYTANADGVGDPVIYTHHHNGKSLSQITKQAQSRLKDRVRHELNVTLEMPGDLTVTPRMKLSLSNTGTIYDQNYDIDSIEFEVSWESGFDMTIECKSARQGRNIDGE